MCLSENIIEGKLCMRNKFSKQGRTCTVYNYLSETRQGDLLIEPNSIEAGINAFKLLVLVAYKVYFLMEGHFLQFYQLAYFQQNERTVGLRFVAR